MQAIHTVRNRLAGTAPPGALYPLPLQRQLRMPLPTFVVPPGLGFCLACVAQEGKGNKGKLHVQAVRPPGMIVNSTPEAQSMSYKGQVSILHYAWHMQVTQVKPQDCQVPSPLCRVPALLPHANRPCVGGALSPGQRLEGLRQVLPWFVRSFARPHARPGTAAQQQGESPQQLDPRYTERVFAQFAN